MSWLRRLANALLPGRLEREIRRELEFHVAERTDELRASGLSAEEAGHRARLRFGNALLTAERTRDVDLARWADQALRNLRHAARSLLRAPGFALTVVATLALGIGANTAVFSALDAVLLRPLPYPDADRLVRLAQKQQTSSESAIAPVRLEEWNRLNSTFRAIAGYYLEDASETSGELPERVRRAFVTPRMLAVWGIAPAQGRGFRDDEHRFGGPPAALVSDRYWRSRLGASPDVLSRSLRFGAAAVTPIVGVMPASFRFPDREVDVWLPSPMDAPFAQSRKATWYTGIGRLRDGASLEQARTDLAALQARLGEQFPDPDRGIGVALLSLKQDAIGGVGPSLWLLFGAVSLLLLIACSNIVALFLARGAARRHEIALRLSLGASRAAIAWLVLSETLLLAALGGGLGLLLAGFATAALRSAGAELPRVDEIAVDGPILLYCSASTLGVALLCGLLPALRATRERAGVASGESSRTQVSGRQPLQWALVGGQVALSVTLLAGAALLVRSFQALARVEPGFDDSRVLSFRMSGSWNETADYPALLARVDRALEALRALPSVEAAATSGWTLPGVPVQWEASYQLVEAAGDTSRTIVADGRAVSPEYFATMRIPLVDGGLCEQRAVGPRGALVEWDAMVNRAFVGRYLADFPSPVGLHLDPEGSGQRGRIVGVVGDARERGIDRAPVPTVYTCLSASSPTPYFLVRTSSDPLALVGAIRARMKQLEPLRSVHDVVTLNERIDAAYSVRRLLTLLLVLFSLSALSLASVGLYGTLSYAVGLRRREVGLRLALGAVGRDIVRQFLGQGLRVVGLACLGGIALALALRRVIAGLLYGVSATDPSTLVAVVAIVVAVAAMASLVPAARAARLEPMRVLREP